MLRNGFEWIRDTRKVRRSIPPEQQGQINPNLPGLMFGETDVKPFGGGDKELVQGTFLFHVEQLREMAKEVKADFVTA